MNPRIRETAEKLGIDALGKTDDQLFDEIKKSAEKLEEVPGVDSIAKQS